MEAEVFSDTLKAKLQGYGKVHFIAKISHMLCSGVFPFIQGLHQKSAVCRLVEDAFRIIDAVDLRHRTAAAEIDGAGRRLLPTDGGGRGLAIADINMPVRKIGQNAVTVPIHVALIKSMETLEILKVFPSDGSHIALLGQGAVSVKEEGVIEGFLAAGKAALQKGFCRLLIFFGKTEIGVVFGKPIPYIVQKFFHRGGNTVLDVENAGLQVAILRFPEIMDPALCASVKKKKQDLVVFAF